MQKYYLNNKAQIDKIGFTAFFVMLALLFFGYAFEYVAPFFFAFLLSELAQPTIRFLTKKFKFSRGFSAFLCLLVAVGLIVVIGSNIASKVFYQAVEFSKQLPYLTKEISVAIANFDLIVSDFLKISPLDIDNGVRTMIDTSISNLTSALGKRVQTTSLHFMSNVPLFIMNTIFFVISSFFFMKDREFITAFFKQNSPKLLADTYAKLKHGIFSALIGYIRAQSIIMSIIAILAITTLVILKYPYAMLIGLLVAFVDALPVFGSGAILLPWAAFSLATGNYTMAIGLAILYVVNFLTRQFLEPKILSTQIGLYPVVTLISIYAGLKLFGVLGFLLGPLLVICIKVLYQQKD